MLLLRRGRLNILAYGSDIMHREIVSYSKYSGMSKASSRMGICFASKQFSVLKSMEEPLFPRAEKSQKPEVVLVYFASFSNVFFRF